MAPIRMPEAVIGLDVGKSSHWACVATRDGEVLLSAPVANREGDLDSLFGRFPDALVVVDQSRNIGALALARARAAGMSAAYLPGLAAHGAARLFAGDAKTDERDAMVIAKTALGIPDALLPVGDPGPTIAAARALAAQRNFLTCENTRNKNRLRSILLESCPAFEALVDLSDGPQLRLMASLGGAWSVADAGPRRAAAFTRGAARGKIEALVRSPAASHGTGRRDGVAPMTKAAIAAGADGVMIEVHDDPERALSDGAQSLSLDAFDALMKDASLIADACSRPFVLPRVLPFAGRAGNAGA